MYSNINTEELVIWVKTLRTDTIGEDGQVHKAMKTAEEIHEELETIDNMLTVMKSANLLNRKRGVKKMLSGIISIAVGDESVTPGTSNLHI